MSSEQKRVKRRLSSIPINEQRPKRQRHNDAAKPQQHTALSAMGRETDVLQLYQVRIRHYLPSAANCEDVWLCGLMARSAAECLRNVQHELADLGLRVAGMGGLEEVRLLDCGWKTSELSQLMTVGAFVNSPAERCSWGTFVRNLITFKVRGEEKTADLTHCPSCSPTQPVGTGVDDVKLARCTACSYAALTPSQATKIMVRVGGNQQAFRNELDSGKLTQLTQLTQSTQSQSTASSSSLPSSSPSTADTPPSSHVPPSSLGQLTVRGHNRQQSSSKHEAVDSSNIWSQLE